MSHVKKHHLKFDKYILAAVLGSFLFSVELIASTFILQYYNPFTFYFIRCSFIFLIAFALFRPSGRELKNKNILSMILIIGLMWAFYRTIIYYGYQTLGVIFTTTIFILSPVLIFLFAIIFLITFALFRPSGSELKNKNILSIILIIGLMWAFYRAIIYYGYQTLGVIFTTTIFILSPVLIFLFAIIFLKEKPTKKQVISTIIITLCVLGSILLGN